MRKITILISAIVAIISTTLKSNAHAIWIQSDYKAIKNKAHQINVFYGEFPEGQPEAVSKWYSDLKELEVWITSPTQKKIKLDLKDVSTHLTSSFIPDEDGVYFITTTHPTKDLGGDTKYEFSSLVTVAVGNVPAKFLAPISALAVIAEAKYYRTKQPIELQINKDGPTLTQAEVLVMSPGGWVKTLQSDAQGKVCFTPPFKGRYVIEVSTSTKESGQWNEQDFMHTWKGSTTSFVVN